jgi:hypothetical protein
MQVLFYGERPGMTYQNDYSANETGMLRAVMEVH